jgi:hypothetical protein
MNFDPLSGKTPLRGIVEGWGALELAALTSGPCSAEHIRHVDYFSSPASTPRRSGSIQSIKEKSVGKPSGDPVGAQGCRWR